MIKGVIFDVDGTLLDSMQIWEHAAAGYLKTMNIEPDETLREILFSMTLEESSSYLKQQYQIPQAAQDIKAGILQVVEQFYKQEVQLKTGIKELLEILDKKNIPMVIASMGDRGLIEAALKRLGVLHYFKKIFICSELNTSKKEPFIFFRAAEYLNQKPEDIMVFEDAIFAISAAKTAGFFTTAVYDAANENDVEKLKKTADCYVENSFDHICQKYF